MSMETVKNDSRDNLYDIARGVAIISVVFGHIKSYNFIYLFHMPFFIALSGFFFKDKYYKTLNNILKFTISKFRRLMFPFIGYTILFEMLHNFFIDIHLYELNSKVLYYHSFLDALKNSIFHIEYLIAPIWFLFALFIISILFSIISYLLQKIYLNNEIYRLVIVLLFLQLGFFISFQPWNKFLYIGTICSSLISFYIGYLFGKISNIKNFFNYKNILFSLFILLIFDLILEHQINIAANKYYNPVLLIIITIVSFLLVLSFASYIKIEKIKKIFLYIGQNTIPILCLHRVSFKIVNYFIYIFNGSILNLSKDPIFFINILEIKISIILFIIYLITGIAVPLLINILYQMLKKRIFYGKINK